MGRASSKYAFALTSCLASALVPALAAAAPPKGAPPPGQSKSSTQFTLRREEAGGADGVVARSRARAGDCAGALSSFDNAIRNTIEPTLRRDRGLCHEKLGNPHPAIDDFRAYLVARPDASDADEIREHLMRLEAQVGEGGPSDGAKDDGGGSGAGGSGNGSGGAASGEASVSVGSGGANASASSSSSSSGKGSRDADAPRDGSDKSYDEYLAQEKLADGADTSPLRRGTGWILGPYVHIPRYFFSDGGTSDMAYSVGGTLRYSTSSSFAILSELGYAATGTSGENSSTSGPLVFLGGELRIPVSRYASDQVLLGAGLGFERYVYSGSRIGVDFVPARARLGFRHVFGPAVAVEGGIDGGAALAFSDVGGDTKVVGVLGGTFAFLVGF